MTFISGTFLVFIDAWKDLMNMIGGKILQAFFYHICFDIMKVQRQLDSIHSKVDSFPNNSYKFEYMHP
jgi:hypothetical protein